MRIGFALALLLALSACQVVLGEDFSQTEHVCDPLTNAGCGDGFGCAVGADQKLRCIASGTVPPGASCANAACAAGATCWTIDGVARCLAYCDLKAPSCAVGHCGTLTKVDGLPVAVCFPDCDLASPRGGTSPLGLCADSQRCIESGAGTKCVTATGTQDDGESCLTALCRPGLSCAIYSDVKKVCEPYCRVALGGADCPSGRKCTPFASGLRISGVEFGSCDR